MAAPVASSYPAAFALEPADRIANWRPIGHLFLAIPHYIVMYALQLVSEVVAFISWLAAVFTGGVPEGLLGVQCMCLRYQMRVYAYVAFMLESYPPFGFASSASDPGDYPGLRVDFRPAAEGRNRLTVFFRILLVIPHLIALGLLWIAGFLSVVVAFFAVLFTGRWPEGLQKFVLGLMRWSTRANAYMFLLTDEYPPFSLD